MTTPRTDALKCCEKCKYLEQVNNFYGVEERCKSKNCPCHTPHTPSITGMSKKYEGVAVVCKVDYPKKGLEVGDYFPTGMYTDEAIDKAIADGKLEVELLNI